MADPTTPSPGTPAIPDALLSYLAAREQRRWENVDRAIGRLTPREQRLVREAAVMGYVQGTRSVPGGHNGKIPPDLQIVGLVVDGCLAMPDLYPLIADYTEPEEPTDGE